MPVNPITNGSNALAATSFSKWRIGGYFRISKEDKRAGESVSISNQRALISAYIKQIEEFVGAEIFEYIDDGLSGANTDRKNYQRMIQDIESGKINCIIVKDVSRIGRNMLETDELLLIYLVERNIRFISIGDRYDSFIQPLSVLEVAITNLFNQDYLHDIAQKSLSSRYVKLKNGERAAGKAVFGYVKSKKEKNKLVIDSEAAEIVRCIFSLALEGKVLREIAAILNAQGLITPSAYKEKRGHSKWRTVDPNYHFWNDNMVWEILTNEQYTGKLVSKHYIMEDQGMFKSKKRAKKDWIIIPGAHPPIISDDVFERTRAILRRRRSGTLADNIFVTKVRCAVCGRIMKRSRKFAPIFKCGTKRFTDHYDCMEQAVSQADIERVVLEYLRIYIDTAIERSELALAALRQSKDTKATIEGSIKAEQQAIKLLEGSITKIFTSMVSGDMSQEAFISKKGVINRSIASKKEHVAELEKKLISLTSGKTVCEEAIAKLDAFRSLDKLDRDSVDYLIYRILIHGDTDIEIVWKDCADLTVSA